MLLERFLNLSVSEGTEVSAVSLALQVTLACAGLMGVRAGKELGLTLNGSFPLPGKWFAYIF